MKYLFVFGNTPDLSKAELESVFRHSTIEFAPVLFEGKNFILDAKTPISSEVFELLGGTVKVGQVVENINFSDINDKKLDFGVSFLGKTDHTSWKRIFLLNKQIKEELAQKGVKGRFVLPAKGETELSSVVVAKQKLHEFIVLNLENGEVVFANTVWVQNFEAWGKRDYGRPAVEAHVGMLPPKIARQMVNLVSGKIITDPFCGTGTILMEGAMVGRKVLGFDIDRKQAERSKANMDWLEVLEKNLEKSQIETGDAKKLSKLLKHKVDAIVTEPDLGPNTNNFPTTIFKKLTDLYVICLGDWKNVLKPDGMVVIALPSVGENRTIVKNVIDKAQSIGYILIYGPFEYARPQAKVKRNICVFRI